MTLKNLFVVVILAMVLITMTMPITASIYADKGHHHESCHKKHHHESCHKKSGKDNGNIGVIGIVEEPVFVHHFHHFHHFGHHFGGNNIFGSPLGSGTGSSYNANLAGLGFGTGDSYNANLAGAGVR